MPYVGNIPAEQYASFEVQHFTTSATTSYTLTHAVANELDIRLVINNVIQQPGGSYAYTAAGTTLTLSAATAGTDTMYCVYIGKAVQTVTPGAGSVGTTALTDNSVTNAKLADATQGDILYYGASGAPAQLSAGTSGYVLQTRGAGANPVWAVDAGGAALTGSTNNTVTTVTGANAIQGETNLQFDGTNLGIGKSPSRTLDMESNGDYFINLNDGTDASVGSTNRGVNLYAGGSIPLKLRTNEVEVTSKLGIGEDAPQQKLHIGEASSNGVYQVFTNDTTGHTASNGLLIGIDNNEDSLFWNYENKKTYFGTNGTTRMQILASNANSGSLVVGGTSWDTWYHFQMRFNGNAGGAMVLDNSETDTNGTAYIQFKQGNTAIGYISRNGVTAGVTYSTSSDYRLKENVNYDFDATTKLKELKPAKFSWKSDPSNQIVDGFLAHEVSSIVPEAITGTKDETETKEKVVINSDGTITAEWIEEEDWIKGKADNTYENDTTWEATKVLPKYQGIDQSKLVPLLVKTIQELEARITTLENA